jgi:hypothetical protein
MSFASSHPSIRAMEDALIITNFITACSTGNVSGVQAHLNNSKHLDLIRGVFIDTALEEARKKHNPAIEALLTPYATPTIEHLPVNVLSSPQEFIDTNVRRQVVEALAQITQLEHMPYWCTLSRELHLNGRLPYFERLLYQKEYFEHEGYLELLSQASPPFTLKELADAFVKNGMAVGSVLQGAFDKYKELARKGLASAPQPSIQAKPPMPSAQGVTYPQFDAEKSSVRAVEPQPSVRPSPLASKKVNYLVDNSCSLDERFRLEIFRVLGEKDYKHQEFWKSLGEKLAAQKRLMFFFPDQYRGYYFKRDEYLGWLSVNPCHFTIEELAREMLAAGTPNIVSVGERLQAECYPGIRAIDSRSTHAQMVSQFAANPPASAVMPAPLVSVPPAPSVAQPAAAGLSEEQFISGCSQFTKDYLKGFNGKKSHSDIIKELQLSNEELSQFDDDCTDPITFLVMDRPVVLFDKVYDLSTILTFNGKDPEKGYEFSPGHILPSRPTKNRFEEIMGEIKKDREKKVSPGIGVPGGSGPRH